MPDELSDGAAVPQHRSTQTLNRNSTTCPHVGLFGLFRVDYGRAGGAGQLGIDIEVPDDEPTSTPADLKDLDDAQP